MVWTHVTSLGCVSESMKASLVRDEAQRRALLSAIVKAIRGVRGLTSAEVARLMGMKHRTYQHWEAGKEAVADERVHAFADVVDADGQAILLALDLGSVEFALGCLINKFGTGLLVSLQRFNARVGRNLTRLDPHSIVTVLDRAFDDLALRSQSFDAVFEDWMIDPAISGDPDDFPLASQADEPDD